MDIWQELGIAPTEDRGEILRAYAKRLSKVRPEDDPEGAERLRLAYEAALSGAYNSLPPPSPDGPSREERLEASRRAAEQRAAMPETPVLQESDPQPLSGPQAGLAADPHDPLMEPAAAVSEVEDWSALSTPSLDTPAAELDSASGTDEALELWSEPADAGGGALPADPASDLGEYSASESWPDPAATDGDPLAGDPLAAYSQADDDLAAEPVEFAEMPTTPHDSPASAAPQSARSRVTLGDLDLVQADQAPDVLSAAPETEPIAAPPLVDLPQETGPDDSRAFAAAHERRDSLHTGRPIAAQRTGEEADAWRERFGRFAPLLAWFDRLRAFLASNKYAELAVLVLVVLALGMATFYGSPFDLIGAAVALICFSALMRPGSGLLLLFGTLASWLGSIVLIRQGTLPEIDTATLFMLVLLMVFGLIKLADRLEERAASRAGR